MRHIEFPMNNFNHVVMNTIVPATNTRSSSIIYCFPLFFVTVISLFLVQQINDLGKATILFSSCFIYACMYNYLNRSQFSSRSVLLFRFPLKGILSWPISAIRVRYEI